MIKAATWVEMKSKLRKAMGWPEGCEWTEAEIAHVSKRFRISCDYDKGFFTATYTKSD